MNNNWKNISALTAALFLSLGVANAFAQYGSGACVPACDIPTSSYAPTCDVSSLDVPSCDVGCGASFSCGLGGCDAGCCRGCGLAPCGSVGGLLDAAFSPFRWIYCEFTDGIFPDCGCAPRPPKTACNPCTICGDYIGGCNDNCEGYSGRNYCCQNDGWNYEQSQNGYANSHPAGVYSSAVYDVEQYDSSPTQGSQALPTLPINRGARDDFSLHRRVFNVQNAVGVTSRASNVRSVGYERQTANNAKVLQAQSQRKNAVPQVRSLERIEVHENQNVHTQRNKQKNQVIVEKPDSNLVRSASSKIFGSTRAVK